MQRIGGGVASIKVKHVEPYIDTVEAFFRIYPGDVRKEVQRLLGKPVRIKRCKDKTSYRLIVNHQPGTEVLAYLAELEKQKWCVLRRVDLAYDFLATSRRQADRIAESLRQHLVLLWRRQKSYLLRVETTIYVCQFENSRNLVLYADKPARRTPELRYRNCAHLELRFQNARSVKRAKLSFAALVDFDPVEFLWRHVRWVEFDAEQWTESFIRNSLADEPMPPARYRLGRSEEQHRAYLRRMVIGTIDRLQLDTAQSYKHRYQRQSKRLKAYPVIRGHI